MAVVFISPRKRQRAFFIGVGASFAVLVVIIFFFVFIKQPSPNEIKITFNKPKVTMSFSIFDQDEFKNLERFEGIPFQYAYIAEDEDGQEIEGLIVAMSEEEAREELESSGLIVLAIGELEFGRDNPFLPF